MENEKESTYDATGHLSYNTLFFEGGLFFDTAEVETDPVEQNRLYRHAMRSYIEALRVLRKETNVEVQRARERYSTLLETSVASLRKSNEAAIFRVNAMD